jgi:hypothetical protein
VDLFLGYLSYPGSVPLPEKALLSWKKDFSWKKRSFRKPSLRRFKGYPEDKS